jgi:hypothetical protein
MEVFRRARCLKWLIPVLILGFLPRGESQSADPDPGATLDVDTRPARITVDELDGFESLPDARRRLIGAALAVAWESPWLPYLAAGSSPEDGGFDCSGATYFVMRKAGLVPARSSGAQMEWLKQHGKLRRVAAEARDREHPSFIDLKPGDLLFWAVPKSGGAFRVHHVAMYLGTEKKDGRPVMIGSTDGRSYRGQKANGYGLQDFRLPRAESPSRLIGYGTPPGLGAD